ncbi:MULTISPECIES: hypothetical protein [Amycolatopsis]|uniref:hypothetical protein n=1 Tax=Amycolatopsis TaxID=1813 RepID=UPI001749F128|nr:hypothetical protein [Amycolatopsis bullii]
MRGPALRRDHVIAASLAGAVVVVVGYASGIGLRPGTTTAAAPPAVADGGNPVTPETPGTPPLPAGPLPTGGPQSPLPALPVDAPSAVTMPSMPPMPGDIGAAPVPDPGSPDPGAAPPPASPEPTTTVPPPPPGTDVPACQPGVAQQLLETVGGLPLLGTVTTGLGMTGPDGAGALILGYCRTADGGLEPAMVPTVPSGR